MLFSRKEVADSINAWFEPAWESVRPVPIVRIDFGNGTTLTRTLHGNIATYVCTADGMALDVLPGIYDPAAYRYQLDQFRLLANYVKRAGKGDPSVVLKKYHADQAAALAKNEPPAVFVNHAGMSKAAIEGGVLAVLVPGKEARRQPPSTGEAPQMDGRDDLANWKLLAEDTKVNETVRRRLIHEKLANTGPVRPEAVKKWLYKEVLHADLDDPYLGLGETLFANYPFAGDEKH